MDDIDYGCPEMMDYDTEDGECPFCGSRLDSRTIFAGCDDEEVYCPACGYVEGIA